MMQGIKEEAVWMQGEVQFAGSLPFPLSTPSVCPVPTLGHEERLSRGATGSRGAGPKLRANQGLVQVLRWRGPCDGRRGPRVRILTGKVLTFLAMLMRRSDLSLVVHPQPRESLLSLSTLTLGQLWLKVTGNRKKLTSWILQGL